MEKSSEKNQIDEPIAAFCLNLIGTLILFIMDRHIKTRPTNLEIEQKKETHLEYESDKDELPF